MPKYRLHYFDARGNAEPLRMLFDAAGVEYEDVRFTAEEWPALKETFRFKQVPVLEIDGKQYGQTLAIAGYLAREFGFYGKTSLDILNIDMVVQILMELWGAAGKYYYEKDPDKKAELLKNLFEVLLPQQLDKLEKLLKENGTGYFVGSSLSLADIVAYCFIGEMQTKAPIALDNYPEMKQLFANILSNERLSAYLKNRKATQEF